MNKEPFLSKLSLLSEPLKNYAYNWLFAFVFAMVGALVCNGVFGVPLYEVIDANLSLVLFVVMVALCLLVIRVATLLIDGELVEAVLLFIFTIVYSFMPFASVFAYSLYGYAGGHPVPGTSFVYDGFMDVALGIYAGVASAVSSMVIGIGGARIAEYAGYLPHTNEMPQWISAIVMLLSLITRWVRPNPA